jgi:hypothetical protein
MRCSKNNRKVKYYLENISFFGFTMVGHWDDLLCEDFSSKSIEVLPVENGPQN